MKYGPSRSEHRFWLWVSLGGLALFAYALWQHWDRLWPNLPAAFELVLLPLLVFGYLLQRSVRGLLRKGE